MLTSAPTRGSTEGGAFRGVLPLAAAAALLPLLSAVRALSARIGDAPAYAAITVLVLVATIYAGAGAVPVAATGSRRRGLASPLVVALLGGAVVAWLARGWIDIVLHQPIDPYRGDMLVVIQQALRRLLQGRDPYALYHVPWEAPLPYGPVLWAPFLVPALLRVDLRVVTLVGALFLPSLAVVGAAVLLRRRHVAAAVVTGATAVAWMANPDLHDFVAIGHTPSYWPLVPLFAWLVVEERWTAAAAMLGVLCVARTTMLSIVPVFAMAAWRRDRAHLMRTLAAFAAPIVILLLPFALWNWSPFEYGLYGSYQKVMKEFVWTSTDWTQHSVGLTGFLIRAHLSRFVEPVQATAMLVTWAAAWRALGRGALPGGWMAIALCVFSATTLWPVLYVYFDVVLLTASVTLFAFGDAREAIAPRRMGALLIALAVVVPAAMRAAAPADITIDVGEEAARRQLARGFSTDEREGNRSFAWIEGTEATLLVPRFGRSAATLSILATPAVAPGGAAQRLTVVMNGVTLGTRTMSAGWQEVSFDAPARAVTAGVNEVQLYFQSAISPREAGTGDDPRRLAAAIDRVRVYSSARLVP